MNQSNKPKKYFEYGDWVLDSRGGIGKVNHWNGDWRIEYSGASVAILGDKPISVNNPKYTLLNKKLARSLVAFANQVRKNPGYVGQNQLFENWYIKNGVLRISKKLLEYLAK